MRSHEVGDVLREWRAVERELEDPGLGPMAREILEAMAVRLRDRYQELVGPPRPNAAIGQTGVETAKAS